MKIPVAIYPARTLTPTILVVGMSKKRTAFEACRCSQNRIVNKKQVKLLKYKSNVVGCFQYLPTLFEKTKASKSTHRVFKETINCFGFFLYR
ncbi:MAG: hypothetical protein N2606_03795 [Candidatus Omnitrophica bacterium]|nr:hypothetical protein [Candidatus Omnitrophota bacterium]